MLRTLLAAAAATAAALLVAGLPAVEPGPTSLIRDGERIVFVGDSITGLGVKFGPGGYVNVFRSALDQARPGHGVEITALGGSGQNVGSWLDILGRSRQAEVFLDVPQVDVRRTLATPVGILVVLLGMNDSLAPYASEDAAGVEAWAGRYRSLITALRERARPRILALGTVTPNSEDADSPKNRLVGRLNQRLVGLAAELDCRVLPTGESVRETLALGRTLRPDFHVTGDFVHPEAAGHAAIAYGLLAGLGERAAAAVVRTARLQPLLEQARGALPALSYSLRPTLPLGADGFTAALTWHWTPAAGAAAAAARASLEVPAGWTVQPATMLGSTGTFTVSGRLDHLRNQVQLRVEDGGIRREQSLVIPAPWLIGHGFANPGVWVHGSWAFQPEQGRLPGEEALLRGVGWGAPPAGWTAAPLHWTRYLASVDHTGGATPGNVNLFAIDAAGNQAGAFGVRWLRSPQERPLRLVIGNSTFAGQTAVQVALNGEPVYAGVITAEAQRRAERPVTLRAGWNVLAFKTNHVSWQWQFSLDLVDGPADGLDGLEVSTTPR